MSLLWFRFLLYFEYHLSSLVSSTTTSPFTTTMNPITMKAVLTKQNNHQPTSAREIELKKNTLTTEEMKDNEFQSMDKNHDGIVSLEEFKTANKEDVEEVSLPSHNSHLGPVWDEYWSKKGRNGHDCSLVPQCDIKMQMNRVRLFVVCCLLFVVCCCSVFFLELND